MLVERSLKPGERAAIYRWLRTGRKDGSKDSFCVRCHALKSVDGSNRSCPNGCVQYGEVQEFTLDYEELVR